MSSDVLPHIQNLCDTFIHPERPKGSGGIFVMLPVAMVSVYLFEDVQSMYSFRLIRMD